MSLIFESIRYIWDEHFKNKERINSIAVETMKQQTLRTSLGLGWVFIRDIVYIVAFTLFRYLMSGSGEIEGMNFVLFLMVGFIPWNFMNECINGGIMAIKSNKFIFSSISFPVVIMSTIEILAIFLKRMFTLILLFILIYIFGDLKDVTWWMFIYYFAAMFLLMCIWNLIFSAIIAISNDFEQLYKAATSILFFIMPIMWSFEIIRPYPWIVRLVKLNPFVYVIEGFRDACLSGQLPDLWYTVYFWGLCFIMFCIGSILQYKLKSHFTDLI